MNYAEAVGRVFRECLFAEDEPKSDPVIVDGITATFGFHPGRLADAKDKLRSLLVGMLPNEFLSTDGGGGSFLRLPMTKNGEHWGDHANCQELMCLAIGAGLARYCVQREWWAALPGGMPYIAFDLGVAPVSP